MVCNIHSISKDVKVVSIYEYYGSNSEEFAKQVCLYGMLNILTRFHIPSSAAQHDYNHLVILILHNSQTWQKGVRLASKATLERFLHSTHLVDGFQPHMKNMRKSNWIISPGIGVEINNLSETTT